MHSKVQNKDSDVKLLGINPGASYGSAKRWYPEKFSEVARELSSSYDIVIFGGIGEREIASDIEKYLIKDKDGKVIKKSENLNFLIDRTSWNRLKLIK